MNRTSPSRLIPFLLSALILTGCDDPDEDLAKPPTPPVAAVETVGMTMNAADLATRNFIGRFAAVSTVDASFEVGGKLTSLPVREGDVVPEGTLLAALSPTDYELALDKAKAAASLAENDLKRKRELADSNAISPSLLDQAEAEHKLRQAELRTAKHRLEQTQILAPFDALITRRLVDAQTNVQANKAVLRIQDVSELRIQVSIPETLIKSNLDRNDFDVFAVIEPPNQKPIRFPLEFRENATEPDPVAQTYTVTFAMPRPTSPTLLPGMSATVEIRLKAAKSKGAPLAPLSAIVTNPDNSHRVWVVDPGTNRVQARAVTLGPIVQGRVSITSGLNPGETIVVAGVAHLKDDMEIRPMDNN